MIHESKAELERLRRLHRRAQLGVSAIKQLVELTPQDELELRALTKLERRLTDRIAWVAGERESLDAPVPM
jgi:hypothetical protein